MNRTREEKIGDRRIEDALSPPVAGRSKSRAVLAYSCSVAAVAVFTWFGFRLHFEVATVGFLYLIVVVVSAAYGNFWQATLTSIVVVACLDYFFFPPLFRFTIEDPKDWLALGTFEFTALMLSHLSRRAQMRTAQAIVERQNSDRLYQTAQRILLLDRSRDPGEFIPPLVREVFGLSTVALFDVPSVSTHLSGNHVRNAEELARNAYYRDREEFDSDTETWSCPLRVGGRPVGGVALSGGQLTPLIATAIASLCAMALERARSFERENLAEAARQVEQLRSAVLDALAHQIKTPLTVIRTASSGLLAAGRLGDPQTELVSLIDDQAQELDELTSRLLGAARLAGADLKPQREPFLLSGLVKDTLKTIDEQQCPSRFQVLIPDREPPVWADRKLIETALVQLIDNAAKYSDPGSPISIEVAAGEADVTVTVRDRGLIIPPADRERIFERFYRGAGSERRSTGTGLGLSIVRKIMNAHQGRVWAESDPEHGTAFFLALPLAESEDRVIRGSKDREIG
jgi:two-component system sensor histidine kinase KdpD